MRSTRRVVITAIVAALYTVFVVFLNPISFGPFQFRVANLLMALMFFDIDYCFGLAFGIFLGNLTSPFGPLDWLVMPVVSLFAALGAYWMKKYFYLGIFFWALITSLGVAVFPLGMGAQLPFLGTFPYIFMSQIVIGFLGYSLLKPFSKTLMNVHK